MEEEDFNSTIIINGTRSTFVFPSIDQSPRLHEAYLFCYCVTILIINSVFIYVILRNNLNRSPFYLALLHISIYGSVCIVCGVLAATSFGVPNYSYHIFINTKRIAVTFQTILFTIFMFNWFMKSEYQARNIIIVFWILTISFIFLGSVAVSCGDRLYYSFYITTFLAFTVLLATFILVTISKFSDILHDEKQRNRTLLVFVYILCFLPNYILSVFGIHLYYYDVVSFICPILMYGYSFINIIVIIMLDSYLRLHFRKICRKNKTYEQNSHFPVDNV